MRSNPESAAELSSVFEQAFPAFRGPNLRGVSGYRPARRRIDSAALISPSTNCRNTPWVSTTACAPLRSGIGYD